MFMCRARRGKPTSGSGGPGTCFGVPLNNIPFTGAVPYAPFPAIHKLQSLSRRRALPFSSFSVSSGPSGNVFSHSVPGRFSANG